MPTKTYIALLRGINVSGHNKIKMIELKQLFIDLGFDNVATYVQSGNVIFKSKENDISKIENNIIEAIKKYFRYTIKVLIITKSELEIIFTSNPFLERINIDISKLCVTMLGNNPTLDNIPQIEGLISNNDDEFNIIRKSIYLYCPNGFGKTKLTNNLFENKLKVSATTRNWKTISKLVELSKI